MATGGSYLIRQLKMKRAPTEAGPPRTMTAKGIAVFFFNRVEPLSRMIRQFIDGKLLDHRTYIDLHGEDIPEIRNWKWTLNTITP